MITTTPNRSFRTLRRAAFCLVAFVLTGLAAAPAAAQVALGADVVSRYVWRGLDFGESLSIQPMLEYSHDFEGGSVAVGTWASYATSPDGGDVNEHDLYASVSFGSFSIGVTDYYFPTLTAGDDDGDFDFFDYEAAHLLEPSVSFSQGPFSLYAATVVYGDADLNREGDASFSTYLEASYGMEVEGVELGLALGVVPMESALYLTDGFALVNVALSAGRAVPITDTFELPLSVSYVLNPELERTYLVFGLSL